MFVEIEKEEGLSGMAIDAWINNAQKDGFTLEDAMGVLKKTNHYGIIKKVGRLIKGLKTPEERLAFKEFVISAVWGRDTSPDTFNLLYNLALEGGYDGEFLEAFTRPKVYKLRKINEIAKNFIVRGKTQLNEFDFTGLDRAVFDLDGDYSKTVAFNNEIVPDICVFKNADILNFNESDLFMKELILEDISDVRFTRIPGVYGKSRVKKLDLSCCDKVKFEYFCFDDCEIKFKEGAEIAFDVTYAPSKLDLPYVKSLILSCSYAGAIDEWNMQGGEYISLRRVSELPKVLDLSGFDKVNLSEANLDGVEKIIFKEGAEVDLSEARNMSCDMNVDAPKKLNLRGCNLTKVKNLSFAEGADVNLMGATLDVSKVDFSVFDKLAINYVDFSGVNELNFRKGAKIEIYGGSNFPKVLDFSETNILFRACNFSGVDELKFEDGCVAKFEYCSHFPKTLDLSNIDISQLENCDFSGVEELKLKGGKSIKIYECKGFSKTLDLSGYDNVCFQWCDLAEIDELKLKDGVNVDFLSINEKFPKVLDLSSAKNVGFTYCIFNNTDEIKFGKGETCKISSSKFCLENLDLSAFDKVDIRDSDFSEVGKMKLGEGSELVFSWLGAKMPKVLDVSGCSEIDFGSSIWELNKVIFRNKMQRYKFFDLKFKEEVRKTLKFKLKCRANFRYNDNVSNAKKKQQKIQKQEKEM